MDKFYAITLDDYGLPSFCSGYSFFIDTLDNIEKYINGIDDDRDKEMKEDLQKTLEIFKSGNRKVEHYVAYSKQRFLRPVKVYDKKRVEKKNFKFTVKNVWDCDYNSITDKITIEHIWVRINNRGYYRFGKVICDNLRFYDFPVEHMEPFWGLPNLIRVENNKTYSTMYLLERWFKNEDLMLKDMEKTRLYAKTDLQEFIYGIIGDG